MYTKILAKGTKFNSGTTGLDNPKIQEHQNKTKKTVLVNLSKTNIQNIKNEKNASSIKIILKQYN